MTAPWHYINGEWHDENGLRVTYEELSVRLDRLAEALRGLLTTAELMDDWREKLPSADFWNRAQEHRYSANEKAHKLAVERSFAALAALDQDEEL